MSISNGVKLDTTHAWNDDGDPLRMQIVFDPSPDEQRRMDLAAWAADPDTPENQIRAFFSVKGMPPTPPPTPVPGIEDAFAGWETPDPHGANNFTGTPASVEATMRPHL